MSNTCPTVKIDDGEGSFIIINESDYDEELHRLYGEKPAKKRQVKAK